MSDNDTLTGQDENNIKNKYEDFDDDENVTLVNLSKDKVYNYYFPEEKWDKVSNY